MIATAKHADWQTRTLGDVCEIKNGSTPNRKEASYWDGGTIPWFTIDDLRKQGQSINITEQRITTKAVSDTSVKLIPKDSVLICCTASVGEVAINKIPLTTNQQFNGLIPNNSVRNDYLFYAVQKIGERIKRTAGKTTIQHLSVGNLVNEKLLLPPLDEQTKISKVLLKADASILSTNELIDRTTQLKKGLMQELFTKGIGHTKFKTLKRQEIPESWDALQLDKVAKVQTGIAKNSGLTGDVVKMPYLRVANVQDGHLDLSEIKTIKVRRSDIDRFRLKVNDVLLTEGGDYDKLGRGFIWKGEVENCLHQNHVFAVRTGDKLNPKFLSYLTQSPYGKKYFLKVAIRTTNLASINSTKLKEFPVLLPPIKEQEQIVEIIESADEKIKINHELKVKQEELKRGLMQDLLTGKVKV